MELTEDGWHAGFKKKDGEDNVPFPNGVSAALSHLRKIILLDVTIETLVR